MCHLCDDFLLHDLLPLVPHHVPGEHGEGVLGAGLQVFYPHCGFKAARLNLDNIANISISYN